MPVNFTLAHSFPPMLLSPLSNIYPRHIAARSLLFLTGQFEFLESKLRRLLRFPTCLDAGAWPGSSLAAQLGTLPLGACSVQSLRFLAFRSVWPMGAACTFPTVPETGSPAREPGERYEHPRNMQVSREFTSSGDFPFPPTSQHRN